MKKNRQAKAFLEHLENIPNVSVACEKVGISRNTVYRWCKEDPDFKDEMDMAIIDGRESVSDLAESKLILKINSGNMRAIQYWLDNNNKRYVKPRPKGLFDSLTGDGPIREIIIKPYNPDDKE